MKCISNPTSQYVDPASDIQILLGINSFCQTQTDPTSQIVVHLLILLVNWGSYQWFIFLYFLLINF